jgi:hypothetical protein
LTDYYTKSEVDGLLENVDVDLTGYATTTYVNTEVAKKADVGHQHTNYAYSTHTHDNYLTAIPDEYITQTELNTALSGLSAGGDDVEVKFRFYDDRNYPPSKEFYTDFTYANNNKEYGQNYLWVDVCINGEHNYFPAFNNATSGGSADLTGYATETYVQQQIAAIEHPTTDLSGYALKSEIPSLSNYATLQYVVTHYANKEDIPDVTGYALKTEIPSLDGYAKTTDIPDVSAYLTEEQVIALINQYGGSGGANLPSGEEVAY